MTKCMICGREEGTIELRYARLVLCENCFKKYFINRVRKTVEEYKMFEPDEKIAVALSGGKDSVALIHSLKMAYPSLDIHAIHIDLGINGYSDKSLSVVKKIAGELDIPLHIYSLKKERGYTIQDFVGTKYGRRICSTCGIIKRYYLSHYAYHIGADALATGHVLDDVIEVMINLFVDGKLDNLIMQKPVLEPIFPNQVRKIKPLIKTYGWETELYVKVNNLPIVDLDCPLRKGARSIRRKKILRQFEEAEPAFYRKIYRVFMKKLIPILEERYNPPRLIPCKICGGPSLTGVCGKCVREIYLREKKDIDVRIGV